jgi:hypothetical protein
VRRSRDDCLVPSLLTTIEKWLDDSRADDLANWSHAYLAHAGGPESRARVADLRVTANKITDAIRALARVTEAISAWLLCAGGRSGSLMPVAQFNPFEKLDQSIMQAGGQNAAYKVWHQLSDERNRYLDGVDAALIGQPKAGGSRSIRRGHRSCRLRWPHRTPPRAPRPGRRFPSLGSAARPSS